MTAFLFQSTVMRAVQLDQRGNNCVYHSKFQSAVMRVVQMDVCDGRHEVIDLFQSAVMRVVQMDIKLRRMALTPG
jgi:hypothetical protein